LNIAGQSETDKKYQSFNDNRTDDEFFDFLTDNLDCIFLCAEEVFYNIGLVQGNKKTIFQIINHYNEKFKDIIYWKKNVVAPHIQKGVINNLVEFILCFGDGARKFINPQFNQGTYWNVIEGSNSSSNKYSDIHKATFPSYLPENIIINFTGRNAVVIDCFGGTGTTLIACEKTHRNCRMMEIDPKYTDVIITRWQDFTGKEAVHESGATFNEMKAQREAA
jgi:DNA modification methylase